AALRLLRRALHEQDRRIVGDGGGDLVAKRVVHGGSWRSGRVGGGQGLERQRGDRSAGVGAGDVGPEAGGGGPAATRGAGRRPRSEITVAWKWSPVPLRSTTSARAPGSAASMRCLSSSVVGMLSITA